MATKNAVLWCGQVNSCTCEDNTPLTAGTTAYYEPNEEPEGGNADHAKRAHEANDPSNDVVPAWTDQWYWRPVAIYVNLWQSMAVYGNLETKFQLVISSLSSIAMRACTSKASTCLVAVVYCAASHMCFHLLAPTYILHLFACSCWILAACICLIRTRSICQVTDWSYLVPEGPLDQLAVDHL